MHNQSHDAAGPREKGMTSNHLQEEVNELKRMAVSLQAQLSAESSLRMASEAIFTSKIAALESKVMRLQQPS